jgi:DNA helicase HerA-like ATPase
MARTGFSAADAWPRGTPKARSEAVEALVANHTLIVGQSRSGKTNAARRLLEEILLWTDARLVLFDPNGDFRWLDQAASRESLGKDFDPDFPPLWDRVRSRVKIASPDSSHSWGIPWGKLSLDEMAAYLKLDPASTFPEYQELRRHYQFEDARRRDKGSDKTAPLDLGTIDEFKDSQYFQISSGDPLDRYRVKLERLAARRAWASTPGNDLDALLRSDFRASVIDLSIDDEEVRTITVARALEVLWKQGEERRTSAMRSEAPGEEDSWRGTLVVVDEAHMFAPPEPLDPQRRLVNERIERFSDQGKKFNLYLMLITQQPNKLNRRILAECNNRIVLRMNDRVSLRLLEEAYGGIRGRYDGTLTFAKGEALFEGTMLCDEDPPPSMPRGVAFRRACTREGGGTPPTNWAKLKTSPF